MIQDPRIDPRLARDLDAAEKNELEAYPDSLGFWTIGRGHKLPAPAPGKSWKGFTILPSVSDRYFVEDIVLATTAAQKLPEWAALDTNARQNALVELCFNMGPREWGTWTPTRTLMQQKNWQAVHAHLLVSLWASQVQPHKFVGGICERCHEPQTSIAHSFCKAIENGRAERIANYFLNGSYPE
jgi:GH24 family phage-related lysozyme (muramidase)